MIYILLVVTLLFLIFNLVTSSFDFFAPRVLFSLIGSACEIICIVFQSAFALQFHSCSLVAFTLGLAVMTAVGILCVRIQKRRERLVLNTAGMEKVASMPEEIPFSNVWYLILALLQVGVILAFVYYLRKLALWWGEDTSLKPMINLYNNMTKFWHTDIEVPIPMFYRIFNPICEAAAYMALYIGLNNFLVTKKINPLPLVNVLLLGILIILNGSRSPLFRVLTMAIFLYYIHGRRANPEDPHPMRFLARIVIIIGIFAAVMLGIVNLMRIPSHHVEWVTYLFIYTGAPMSNFDLFFAGHPDAFFHGMSRYFGETTFSSLWSYLDKHGIVSYQPSYRLSVFAFSRNGIEIGNVYTTFASFVYDFGVFGIIPLMAILSLYYVFGYAHCIHPRTNGKKFDFGLFIYAYLFNDLCMLWFSNRFYETIFNISFIKILVFSWVLDVVLIEHRITVGKKTISLPWLSKRTG